MIHAYGTVKIQSIDEIKKEGFITSYLGWVLPPEKWFPSKFSNTFETGESVTKKDEWKLRDIPSHKHGKILYESEGKGKIIEDENNGVCNSGHYWWHVKLETYEGWCAEEGLSAMKDETEDTEE